MSIQPVPYDDGSFRFQGGTAEIDPKWIDIDILKLWLWTCDSEHHSLCFDNVSYGSGGPRWLIDVVKGSLVPAEAEYQYAALSYVWGQTETVRTSTDNLAYLLEEGSIFARERLLPKTIRDTIGLVRLLGINYLWVDCLCIVQDDAEMKHAQIQEMAMVYAQAYVTIIAANGWDANHGLRGIRNVTEPRQLSRYAGDNFYESLQPHSSFWYSRGWTFQEMVFARRKIMFHYQVAVWECQCDTWHEAMKTGRIPIINSVLGFEFQINRRGWRNIFDLWPNVQLYIEMVREYNNRKLTFPADGLNAIAGLLAAWNRSFHGGFICGLTQMFFDYALLWQPLEPLQRRISKAFGDEKNMLPSWSWVGWEGEINSLDWASQWDYISPIYYKGRVVWKLISTVDWSYGTSLEDRQPIEVSSHRYRACLTDESMLLPKGWSRKSSYGAIILDEESANENKNSELSKPDYFVYTDFVEVEFAYPIPFPERDEKNHIQNAPQFLFGRTHRAFLKGTSEDHSSSLRIHLWDDRGNRAGSLQLHDSALANFKNGRDSREFELVSISFGRATPKSSGYGRREWFLTAPDQQDGDLYEYYNVLYIEWEEDVAYRKGMGKVNKEAWERQATEWIDLKLG